jgi:PAT family beta-lactamase induction signal transducer AmpG
MVGGRALGVVVTSAVLGWLADQSGWPVVFWALAGVTLVPLPFVLGAVEPPRSAEQRFEWKAFRALGQGSILALAALGLLYSLITNGANSVVNPFLEESFQITKTAAGFYTSLWGIGVIVGALSGGQLVDRIGQRRAVIGAIAVSLVSLLGLAAIPNPLVAWPLVFIFGLAFGYYDTVFFALAMEGSDRRIAASMFSILMALANVGTGIGLWLAGESVFASGYRLTFVTFALFNLVALPLILPIFARRKPAEC